MTKENVRDNILMEMKPHLDSIQLDILKGVVITQLAAVELLEKEKQLPATMDETNRYMWEIFLFKAGQKLSPGTVTAYRDTMRHFDNFTRKPFNQVTELDVDRYLHYLKEKGLAPATLNNNLRNISSFYLWMIKARVMKENPCSGVEPYAVPEKPIDHLTPQEWDQLKTGCRHLRDRALLEFLRCTAMRDGEVPAVNICDVDWRKGELIIYGSKGKCFRVVCLDDLAVCHLMKYLEQRGESLDSKEPLFAGIRSRARLQQGGLYASIKTIAARSGLGHNVYPHLLRKTTATTIVNRGGSDEAAGEYLGHAPRTVSGRHYAFKGAEHKIKIFQQYVRTI